MSLNVSKRVFVVTDSEYQECSKRTKMSYYTSNVREETLLEIVEKNLENILFKTSVDWEDALIDIKLEGDMFMVTKEDIRYVVRCIFNAFMRNENTVEYVGELTKVPKVLFDSFHGVFINSLCHYLGRIVGTYGSYSRNDVLNTIITFRKVHLGKFVDVFWKLFQEAEGPEENDYDYDDEDSDYCSNEL